MKKEMLSIAFVGDISLGDSLFCQGFGCRSVAKIKGGQFFFQDIKKILKENQIVFGNLETVLSRHGEDINSLDSVHMRGDPENVVTLRKAGFHMLNIANNHSMQHGKGPFEETVSLLKANGISVVGLRGVFPYHSEPVILDLGNLRIGFLGYAFEVERYQLEEIRYAFGVEHHIIEDIAKLRTEVDILVVSNHWGLEFMDRPSINTIRIARQEIEAGADIVVGHHPHVLQGIERYKNGLIAYSLGNFVFDMLWEATFCESMILKVKIYKDKKLDYEIIPAAIQKDLRIVPLCGQKKQDLLKKINFLSQKISAELTGDLEKNSLKYYEEYSKLVQRYRWKAYLYFLSKFTNYKKVYLIQQIQKTIQSKIEDFMS